MNNHEIIENYYRTHRNELIVFVSALMHTKAEAEDLVHDVFMRLLSGKRPICEQTIRSLVLTLCRHQVIDWYRRHSVRTDVEHELSQTTAACDTSAESVLSIREINEQLEHCLATLPKECGEIYRLHIYGGLQARDICRQTGEKYKAVEYRLALARKQVRSSLRYANE